MAIDTGEKQFYLLDKTMDVLLDKPLLSMVYSYLLSKQINQDTTALDYQKKVESWLGDIKFTRELNRRTIMLQTPETAHEYFAPDINTTDEYKYQDRFEKKINSILTTQLQFLSIVIQDMGGDSFANFFQK